VLTALRSKYAKLRLRVNEEKSTVAWVWGRTFLGYSFWVAKGKMVKLRVAPKALGEMKQRVRQNSPERRTEHGTGHERTRFRELTALGLPEWLVRKGAGYGGRWWWAASLGAMHTALPGSYCERLGVPRLAAQTSTH
jgi:hypothetical protein